MKISSIDIETTGLNPKLLRAYGEHDLIDSFERLDKYYA